MTEEQMNAIGALVSEAHTLLQQADQRLYTLEGMLVEAERRERESAQSAAG